MLAPFHGNGLGEGLADWRPTKTLIGTGQDGDHESENRRPKARLGSGYINRATQRSGPML